MSRLELIQYRRGAAALWTSVNPVLESGEPGFETDTGKQKIGDGVTAWTSLGYQADGAGMAAALALKADKTTTVNGHPLSANVTVTKADVTLGSVDNTSDATKNAAAVALTNKDLTSGTNTFPTLNQNTTGSAARLTTARTINGTSFDGTGNITVTAAPSGSATGDLTGSYPAPTLATSGVSAATYGSATQVPQVAIDAKGRATSASNVAIQIAESQVTDLVTDLE